MTLTVLTPSNWVIGASSVTPGVPFGTAAGDYVVLTLVSKYDDALLGGAPAGWDDLGTAFNTGLSAGADSGNLRMRVFGKVWAAGDTMPSLAPTPNNVSAVKAALFRATSGVYDVVCKAVADNTVGTPLAVTTPLIFFTVGDRVMYDIVMNGDLATWGATTRTATGVTFTADNVSVSDTSTTTGTDLRMRSRDTSVSVGNTNAAMTVSTALSGTTTNAAGCVAVVRIREVAAPPSGPTVYGCGIPI